MFSQPGPFLVLYGGRKMIKENADGIISKELTLKPYYQNLKVRVSFSEKWFEADSSVYNHDLARFCSIYSMVGYSMPAPGSESVGCGARAALEAIGMEKTVVVSGTGRDEVDYFISAKKINVSGKENTLIICAPLGSHYGQWYANFDAGEGEIHRGFDAARSFILCRLMEFYGEIGGEKENTKLLFIGHSRGGAAAYLLAAQLIDEESLAYKENIFTYTFAAPNSVKESRAADEKYGRIFNFVNDEDFVTKCMPEKWGYTRFGKTLVLPNSDNCPGYESVLSKMNCYYSDFTGGKKFVCFKNGTKTVSSLFDSLCGYVDNISEYYNKKFPCLGKNITVFDYFSQSLCAVTGEDAGTQKNKDGTMMLIKTTIMRPVCHPVFRKIADFFVVYEGLAGATGGKISDSYFSFAHDISAYCAYLCACDERILIRK